MGCNKLVAFTMFAIILPALAMATEFTVGDGRGWSLGVNYTEWAQGKVFRVGDKLVFKYEAPHNVYRVDGDGFEECKPSQNLLNTGNDTITLAQPGKKWYICGFSDHCIQGQRVVINVESEAQPPASGGIRVFPSGYHIFMAALVVMAVVAI